MTVAPRPKSPFTARSTVHITTLSQCEPDLDALSWTFVHVPTDHLVLAVGEAGSIFPLSDRVLSTRAFVLLLVLLAMTLLTRWLKVKSSVKADARTSQDKGNSEPTSAQPRIPKKVAPAELGQ
jgi:ABC-type transport system involved in cytochrome bd biosynthesis fused ATPase/permease subunit